ncbi:hypothetical protein Dda_4973 [Drechslerella dactyloides]|uniref:F-box domain-containing protein n=1 Tax=Drechslerella dactyloides TaxID=74499 RepID=A0AAD6IXW8_DREDA|nr:hypothetical protein Dda_4973 [Drechslerella dactyloides]
MSSVITPRAVIRYSYPHNSLLAPGYHHLFVLEFCRGDGSIFSMNIQTKTEADITNYEWIPLCTVENQPLPKNDDAPDNKVAPTAVVVAANPGRSPLSCVPPEILLKIETHLPSPQDTLALAATCRSFRDALYNNDYGWWLKLRAAPHTTAENKTEFQPRIGWSGIAINILQMRGEWSNSCTVCLSSYGVCYLNNAGIFFAFICNNCIHKLYMPLRQAQDLFPEVPLAPTLVTHKVERRSTTGYTYAPMVRRSCLFKITRTDIGNPAQYNARRLVKQAHDYAFLTQCRRYIDMALQSLWEIYTNDYQSYHCIITPKEIYDFFNAEIEKHGLARPRSDWVESGISAECESVRRKLCNRRVPIERQEVRDICRDLHDAADNALVRVFGYRSPFNNDPVTGTSLYMNARKTLMDKWIKRSFKKKYAARFKEKKVPMKKALTSCVLCHGVDAKPEKAQMIVPGEMAVHVFKRHYDEFNNGNAWRWPSWGCVPVVPAEEGVSTSTA